MQPWQPFDTHANSFEVSQSAATNLRQSVTKTTYKMEIKPKYTVSETSQTKRRKKAQTVIKCFPMYTKLNRVLF
jgi:hypothetical protein